MVVMTGVLLALRGGVRGRSSAPHSAGNIPPLSGSGQNVPSAAGQTRWRPADEGGDGTQGWARCERGPMTQRTPPPRSHPRPLEWGCARGGTDMRRSPLRSPLQAQGQHSARRSSSQVRAGPRAPGTEHAASRHAHQISSPTRSCSSRKTSPSRFRRCKASQESQREETCPQQGSRDSVSRG